MVGSNSVTRIVDDISECGATTDEIRSVIRDSLLKDESLIYALGGPHVEVGEVRADGNGFSVEMHAYNREGGYRRAQENAAALLQSFDDVPLLISGRRVADTRATTADIRRCADGTTYHAMVRAAAVYDDEPDGGVVNSAPPVSPEKHDVTIQRRKSDGWFRATCNNSKCMWARAYHPSNEDEMRNEAQAHANGEEWECVETISRKRSERNETLGM